LAGPPGLVGIEGPEGPKVNIHGSFYLKKYIEILYFMITINYIRV